MGDESFPQQMKAQKELATRPIAEDLLELLQNWIETPTWGESLEFLNTHAERLLSDETTEALAILIAGSEGEDEQSIKTLDDHLSLVQKSRSGSPEAAYRELVNISHFQLFLLTLPAELRKALRAFMQVSNSNELQDLLANEPILLEQETLTIIDTLLEQLQEADEKEAAFVQERYATLQQIAEDQPNQLAQLVRMLLNADSPTELRRVIAQFPDLLEAETLEGLLELANRAEQAGDLFTAPRLRLRVSELQQLLAQREQNARLLLPVPQTRVLPAPETTIGIHAVRGSIGGYEIYNASVTNIHFEGLERRWQEPARQTFADKKAFVGRQAELEKALACLVQGEDVAIVGKERAVTVALQGMAGIGKTYLARKLAADLYEHFEHRVIWLDLRLELSDEVSGQLLLGQLAR